MGRHLRHAILLAAALAPAFLSAQTAKTWTGTEWADFATGANWSGATAPTNNTTTNYALFTSGSGTGNFAALSANRSIAGVEFAATANGGGLSYAAGTPVLTLGAYGIRNYSLASVDIDVALALGTASTFTSSGDTLWITSSLNLGANTLTLAGGSDYFARLSGPISGSGGITLNYTGAGGWLLGASNTYSGATTLTAGSVIADSGGFGTGTLVFNGGTLATNGAVTHTNAISVAGTAKISTTTSGAITLTGAATLTGSRTFEVSGTGAVIFNGAIGQSAAGYGLTKTGTGTMVLNAASTYTGPTAITGGSLALGSNGTISNANLTLNGGTLATSGTWTRTLGTGAGQFQFGTGGGGFAAYGGPLSVTIATGDPLWYNLFNGQWARFGSAVADNVVTFTNNLDLAPSTDHFFAVTDNPDTTADAVRLTGVLSGSGNLYKQGEGTLVVTGTNTNTGTFGISGGTVRAESASAFGTGAVSVQSSTLELARDAATAFGNNVSTTSGSTTFRQDRLTPGAGLVHDFGNLANGSNSSFQRSANVTSGTALFRFASGSGGGTYNVASGVGLEFTGAHSGSVVLTVTGDGSTTFGGMFHNGASALTKSGAGTLTLNATSPRTGVTNLNAGTLILNASGALGTGALNLGGNATLGGTGAVTIANAFTNTGNYTLAVTNTGDTTFTGNVALSNSATNRIFTLANTGDVTFTGPIANGSTSTSGLTKTGTGLLTLSGANTFTGNTTINAGTFNLTSSLVSPTLTIADGATLTGAGSLKSLSLAGLYSPGNSPALVSLDNLTMVSTAVLNLEIGGLLRGTEHDALNIGGALTAAGTLNISFINGFMPSGSTTFDLFDFSSASGSFATINLPALDWHWTWDTTNLLTTGELSLNFAAVPEPSTYALLATGLGLAVLARRRRNGSRS